MFVIAKKVVDGCTGDEKELYFFGRDYNGKEIWISDYLSAPKFNERTGADLFIELTETNDKLFKRQLV